MATTFQELYDELDLECQELQGEADYNPIITKRLINRAYHSFAKDVDLLNAEFSFTTIADQQFYTSSDVANWAYAYRIINVKYIEDASAEFGKILYPYPGGYDNLPKLLSSGTPTWYYTFGRQGTPIQKIGTYPVIGTSDYTLKVNAYHYPTTELSQTSDVPLIPEEYRDALIYYAAWRMFIRYGHRNPAWAKKALEYKISYREFVGDYKMQHFIEDQLPQVQDIYTTSNWII